MKSPASFFVLFFLGLQTLIIGQEVILPAASCMEDYLPVLKGKQVGLVANPSSMVGKNHLADTLLHAGIRVLRIFAPEHGFRGKEDAGEDVASYRDRSTGIQVRSLYGKNVKPLPADVKDLDLMIFDLQDVGTRFYTYLSTLHYVMEACAENDLPLLVLDRPNPNGFYIDGPVLQDAYRSFVGLHPVPVVYGMTIGEYACMINGEHWLKGGVECALRVVPCRGYRHSMRYDLPVRPSPNLPDMLSVYLYPSLAFFEGTNVSVGRGTAFPFKVYGSPYMEKTDFSFVPAALPGMSANPMYKGRVCHGWDLRNLNPDSLRCRSGLDLSYLVTALRHNSRKDEFFNAYFNLLAGNDEFQQQLREGKSGAEIRESWKPGLDRFRKMRAKYLIYPE